MDQKTLQFIFLFLVALGYAEKLKTSSIKQWLVSIHFCKSEDETCDQSLSRQSSTVCQKPIVLDSTNKPTTFKFHWFFGEV